MEIHDYHIAEAARKNGLAEGRTKGLVEGRTEMKDWESMKLLIDTNVVPDVLLRCEPFAEDAAKIAGQYLAAYSASASARSSWD